MPKVSVNGIELYYEVHEPKQLYDRTPLLLIAGLGLNSLSWHKLLPGLSAQRPVIIFDNRGAGRSSKPDSPYSTRLLAQDTAGLLDALGVRRAHVFGFSLGSLVAQELALNYRTKVKNLILGASTPGGFHHIPAPSGVIELMRERGEISPANAAKLGVPVIYSRRFIEQNQALIEQDIALRLVHPTPAYAYRRQMLAGMMHNTYDRLDQLPMPTLLVTGDEDILIVPGNSTRLARRIPRAQLAILPEAAHNFISEQPFLTIRTINDFLAQGSARRLPHPMPAPGFANFAQVERSLAA